MLSMRSRPSSPWTANQMAAPSTTRMGWERNEGMARKALVGYNPDFPMGAVEHSQEAL